MGRQSKIYAESNQSVFWRISGDFTSIQTLSIYRGLLVRKKAGGLNRDAMIRDDRDRDMFFLLRMAFWLGLVLVLLPRDPTPKSEKAPQIGASEAISAASAAASDMGQLRTDSRRPVRSAARRQRRSASAPRMAPARSTRSSPTRSPRSPTSSPASNPARPRRSPTTPVQSTPGPQLQPRQPTR